MYIAHMPARRSITDSPGSLPLISVRAPFASRSPPVVQVTVDVLGTTITMFLAQAMLGAGENEPPVSS